MSQPKLWEVVYAREASEEALGKPVTDYSEWLRLLVGRSLAFSQASTKAGFCEYLVLGAGRGQFDQADPALEEIRKAVNADFDILKKLSEHYKEQLHSKHTIDSPERFLQSYAVLAMLRLPEQDEDWRVTDEGLTIVNWGLKKGKPWFEWSPEDLNEQLRITLERCGLLTSAGSAKASVGGPTPQVNAAKAAIAQDPSSPTAISRGQRTEGLSGAAVQAGQEHTSASRFNWMKSYWMKLAAIIAAIIALVMIVAVAEILLYPKPTASESVREK